MFIVIIISIINVTSQRTGHIRVKFTSLNGFIVKEMEILRVLCNLFIEKRGLMLFCL